MRFVTRVAELVHFFLRPIFGAAVTLLDSADELVLLASNHIQVVVGQLAPFLLHFSLELFPLAFHRAPVHVDLLLEWEKSKAADGLPRPFLGPGGPGPFW